MSAYVQGKSLKEALQEAGQLWKALPETVAAASGSPCKAQYKQAADALMVRAYRTAIQASKPTTSRLSWQLAPRTAARA